MSCGKTSISHDGAINSILFNTTCALNHIALVTVDLSVKPGS